MKQESSLSQSKSDQLLSESLTRGVMFARSLVNTPAGCLTPKELSKSAQSIAESTGNSNLKVNVVSKATCEQLRMGAFLAVGEASDNDAHLIHLKLSKEDPSKRKLRICLIGKGVCFDSGGYNLKVGAGSSIHLMKYDMAGSAAVLGAMAALSDYLNHEEHSGLLDSVEIHGCIAACENLVSGKQNVLRPGDVVTAANGLTVEVNNTDAEGRLTLADAIWYARTKDAGSRVKDASLAGVQTIDADVIIDIATLTGAIKVANGPSFSGYYSNSDALAALIDESAKQRSGDESWRYPLFSEYKKSLKSNVADMVNSATNISGAGSITAGLFLKRFVDDSKTNPKIPLWAHMDVAGPVWASAKGTEMNKPGATGFGVRLLSHVVLQSPSLLRD